jgi:carbon-monoxide dehydrogenase medium subunit
MKPPSFTYHAPDSLESCLDLLAEHGDDAALMAGGQSLLSLMKFRLAQPMHVISIRSIGTELGGIHRTDYGVSIGAAVTYFEAQQSDLVRTTCPALLDTIPLIAHPGVRTRGTLCGNLCNADPASELPAVALVMHARFHLRSRNGDRLINVEDFLQGPYMTARQPDEMLIAIEFRRQGPAERFAIQEVTRSRGGFPLAGVALSMTPGPGIALTSVSIACFGVHSMQMRIPEAEVALEKHGRTRQGIAVAGERISAAIRPHSDPYASEDYRRAVTRTLFERAITEAA